MCGGLVRNEGRITSVDGVDDVVYVFDKTSKVLEGVGGRFLDRGHGAGGG